MSSYGDRSVECEDQERQAADTSARYGFHRPASRRSRVAEMRGLSGPSRRGTRHRRQGQMIRVPRDPPFRLMLNRRSFPERPVKLAERRTSTANDQYSYTRQSARNVRARCAPDYRGKVLDPRGGRSVGRTSVASGGGAGDQG